ncbi:predicted protein [Botrytis cinerea T4]|uniref:Uncharacterized protein n=1 Tax=Botryotinia fuckeliana (strain T4) TaxID=999810 RepID=G2YZ56_BOTF4|nr:predicted protein [Botrytis cinerea T4]
MGQLPTTGLGTGRQRSSDIYRQFRTTCTSYMQNVGRPSIIPVAYLAKKYYQAHDERHLITL